MVAQVKMTFVVMENEKMYEEYRVGAITMSDRTDYIQPDLQPTCNQATTLTKADAVNLLRGSYINQVKVGNSTGIIRDTAAHDEIAELREMIERLKGKPYYMKIQCHNCGAPLVIESSDHLIKCKYCHTAYFSGTQLVNSER